jgi:hypothetical protein
MSPQPLAVWCRNHATAFERSEETFAPWPKASMKVASFPDDPVANSPIPSRASQYRVYCVSALGAVKRTVADAECTASP